MKKMYSNLIKGALCSILVLGIFLSYQYYFAQSFAQKGQELSSKSDSVGLTKLNNDAIRILGEKVENMQKYVDASQKNLDGWLKLLAFILSVLIGYSIFSGLKSRELAKDELAEIRRIREGINREAINAEDRLRVVREQLTQIENTATNAKSIEQEMTRQLKEFGNRSDIALDQAQKSKLDELINTAKSDLQNSGIEAFKNLYFAKALKSDDNNSWEDSIRLWSVYIDLEENSASAYHNRGRAYSFWAQEKGNDIDLGNKALKDYNEAIRINNKLSLAYYNRGTLLYNIMGENEKAILDYSEAIRLYPNYTLAYHSRSTVYKELGKTIEAEADLARVKELDPEMAFLKN